MRLPIFWFVVSRWNSEKEVKDGEGIRIKLRDRHWIRWCSIVRMYIRVHRKYATERTGLLRDRLR